MLSSDPLDSVREEDEEAEEQTVVAVEEVEDEAALWAEAEERERLEAMTL